MLKKEIKNEIKAKINKCSNMFNLLQAIEQELTAQNKEEYQLRDKAIFWKNKGLTIKDSCRAWEKVHNKELEINYNKYLFKHYAHQLAHRIGALLWEYKEDINSRKGWETVNEIIKERFNFLGVDAFGVFLVQSYDGSTIDLHIYTSSNYSYIKLLNQYYITSYYVEVLTNKDLYNYEFDALNTLEDYKKAIEQYNSNLGKLKETARQQEKDFYKLEEVGLEHYSYDKID